SVATSKNGQPLSAALSQDPAIPRLPGLPVAQQLAWGGTGTLPILKDRLPVDHNPAISLSPLHPPPLSSRQIIDNFVGQGLQLLQIVDDNICRQPLTQGAPILKAGGPGH